MESPHESRRLLDKVNAHAWNDRYLVPHMAECSHVLEVGCGPGALLAALSRKYPTVNMTGVDVSTDRLLAAADSVTSSLATFVCADAADLPLADASFEIAFTRFLLEYVPDKPRVVAEMARVVRPGGLVLLQDLDGQLVSHYPPDPGVDHDVSIVLESLGRTGFDPFVGRKLYAFARSAGLENLAVVIEPYHLVVGAIDVDNLEHWRRKLSIAEPVMAEALGSQSKARCAADSYLDYLQREDTLTFSLLFTITGAVPAPNRS